VVSTVAVITAGLFIGNSFSSLALGILIGAEAVVAFPLMFRIIVSFAPSWETMLKVTLELLTL
jgi:hypothetical protein